MHHLPASAIHQHGLMEIEESDPEQVLIERHKRMAPTTVPGWTRGSTGRGKTEAVRPIREGERALVAENERDLSRADEQCGVIQVIQRRELVAGDGTGIIGRMAERGH